MKKPQILFIDDDQIFLELIKKRVETWGYTVALAHDGKEGLKLIREKKAEVVVLDYLMSGMDGVAVLKEIRNINKTIPVIMLTAHPDVKVIAGTEALGVSSFVPKVSEYTDTETSLRAALDMAEKQLEKSN